MAALRRNAQIAVVAVLDIVISGILTCLLFLTLSFMSGDVTPGTTILAKVEQSVQWFVLAGRSLLDVFQRVPVYAAPVPADLQLLPLLLTTFVPVAFYMSVFVLLSFVKAVMSVTCRTLEAVGERNESVFRQFGVLIATVMAAAKAIYDYISTL